MPRSLNQAIDVCTCRKRRYYVRQLSPTRSRKQPYRIPQGDMPLSYTHMRAREFLSLFIGSLQRSEDASHVCDFSQPRRHTTGMSFRARTRMRGELSRVQSARRRGRFDWEFLLFMSLIECRLHARWLDATMNCGLR